MEFQSAEAEAASSEAEVAAAMAEREPERVMLMQHAPKHSVSRYTTDKVSLLSLSGFECRGVVPTRPQR